MTVAFAPKGRTLAWGTATGMIEIWDAGIGRRISAWRGHSSSVKSLAFSPDGRMLATGGDDAAVRVWEVPKPDHALKHTNQALHVRKPS